VANAPLSTENILTKTLGTKTANAEWNVLLRCTRPGLDSQRLNELFHAPVNWPALFALAEEHALLPQLAARIRAIDSQLVPPEAREQLNEWNRRHTVFTLRVLAELLRLIDHFTAMNLAFLLTKGPVLAQRCYGDPGLRQYADLDLIVRHRDIRRTSEAMSELGYEPRISPKAIAAEKIPGEFVFRHPDTNLLVEFHTERTFRYHPRALPLDKIFERSARVWLDDHEIPALSLEDELVLICIHSAKHLWEQLSWVADVAALISHQSAWEWKRVAEAASEVGAERMLRVGLRLASDMLGVSLPAEVDTEVRSDAGARRLAAQLAERMPSADSAQIGILQRAMFRIRMRGSYWRGLPYFLRLSLSPTEEDWQLGSEGKRSSLFDALGRPFRLFRKYGSRSEIERARIAKSEPS
jgi:putative nucleotidyltransferase-like protein